MRSKVRAATWVWMWAVRERVAGTVEMIWVGLGTKKVGVQRDGVMREVVVGLVVWVGMRVEEEGWLGRGVCACRRVSWCSD